MENDSFGGFRHADERFYLVSRKERGLVVGLFGYGGGDMRRGAAVVRSWGERREVRGDRRKAWGGGQNQSIIPSPT